MDLNDSHPTINPRRFSTPTDTNVLDTSPPVFTRETSLWLDRRVVPPRIPRTWVHYLLNVIYNIMRHSLGHTAIASVSTKDHEQC